MSNHQSEERALEVMRKELAAQNGPELPWDKMERELMARLDDAPMTSQPRSLDARVDDVPVSSIRAHRFPFVHVGFVAFAAAAAFALFWMSPLHSGKPIVISSATPPVAVPASSANFAEPVQPKTPVTNPPAVPAPSSSAAAEPPPRTIQAKDVKAAFLGCVSLDKQYAKNPAAKLKGEKLEVFLEPDGRVATIRFDSPLDANVMQCVFSELGSARFVKTTKPVTIQF